MRFVRGHQNRGRRFAQYGCWEWRRKITSRGYGILEVEPGRAMHAHRWVWLRERGELDPGCHLHHTCGNRLCVNPAHLEALSPEDHQRMHKTRKRRVAA
jgi:hypothetical protein